MLTLAVISIEQEASRLGPNKVSGEIVLKMSPLCSRYIVILVY